MSTQPAPRGFSPALPARLNELPFGAIWRQLPDLAARGWADPGSTRDRLAMYRLLIEHTGGRSVVGSAGEHHVFWGYASQLRWQQSSGRLGAAPDAPSIDRSSWWGNMNATLSVIPLRAAMRGGWIPRVQLASWPSLAHGFETALGLWQRFFARLQLARSSLALPQLCRSAWQAHLASIQEGLRRFEHQRAALPIAEQRFALGWVRMVDFLAIAAIPTDFHASLRWGSGTLPRHVLSDRDASSVSTDTDPETRRTIRAVIGLGMRPTWRFELDRAMWQRAMRAPEIRDEAGDILLGPKGRDRAVQRRVLRAVLMGF